MTLRQANAYNTAILRRLKHLNLEPEVLEKVRFAVVNKLVKKKVPREVSKRLAEVVAEHGRAVVVLNKSNGWRIYSLEKYTNSLTAGTRNMRIAAANRSANVVQEFNADLT